LLLVSMMDAMDRVVEAVCRLPIDFESLGNVSEVELVRRSGYLDLRKQMTVDHLATCLRDHPDWVRAWFLWSDNQRSSPNWWLAGWISHEYTLGYYDPKVDREAPPMRFDDKVEACAEYVSRAIASTADTIDRIEAIRQPGESDLDAAIRLSHTEG
jgi:hypothetical protein